MLEEVVVTATKRSRSYNESTADFAHAVAPKASKSSFDEIIYSAEIFVDFSAVTDKPNRNPMDLYQGLLLITSIHLLAAQHPARTLFWYHSKL